MTWYEIIVAAHGLVTDNVSHNKYLKSNRYFVWQEEGTRCLCADNKHKAKTVTGTTDLFTKMEFDPWGEELGKAFDQFGLSWTLHSIQYEEETGFYHYEWLWEVTD